MRTDQQLNLTGKDSRFATDHFINIAILQKAIVLGIALAHDFIV